MTPGATGSRRGLRWALAGLGVACLVAAAMMWVTGVGMRADARPAGVHASPPPQAVVAPAAPQQGPAAAPLVEPPPGPSGASPVQLRLAGRPVVAVDPVGVSPDGSMQVPDDQARAGWWTGGAAPGDPAGTTVLVGHLDSASGGLGAFAALLDLPAGTRLAVVDSTGTAHQYRVTGTQQVVKSDLSPSTFARDGSPRLVLITCGGAFSRVTHHYDDNVVVTAVPVDG